MNIIKTKITPKNSEYIKNSRHMESLVKDLNDMTSLCDSKIAVADTGFDLFTSEGFFQTLVYWKIILGKKILMHQ